LIHPDRNSPTARRKHLGIAIIGERRGEVAADPAAQRPGDSRVDLADTGEGDANGRIGRERSLGAGHEAIRRKIDHANLDRLPIRNAHHRAEFDFVALDLPAFKPASQQARGGAHKYSEEMLTIGSKIGKMD
jgi:hypothetical protein